MYCSSCGTKQEEGATSCVRCQATIPQHSPAKADVELETPVLVLIFFLTLACGLLLPIYLLFIGTLGAAIFFSSYRKSFPVRTASARRPILFALMLVVFFYFSIVLFIQR